MKSSINPFEDHYYFRSKNINNQIIFCDFCRIDNTNYFNFSFYITNKRSKGFPDDKITGTDGIRSLVWAYNCLKECLKYGNKYYKGCALIVDGDRRRKNIYTRYLIPLGFTISKDRYRLLIYKFK